MLANIFWKLFYAPYSTDFFFSHSKSIHKNRKSTHIWCVFDQNLDPFKRGKLEEGRAVARANYYSINKKLI